MKWQLIAIFVLGVLVILMLTPAQNKAYEEVLVEKAKIAESMGGYPQTLADAIALTKELGDKTPAMDWVAQPWTGNDRRSLEIYSRVHMGYYLTMRMNESCGGNYENVAFQMHELKNGKWETTHSVNLEAVNFNDSSGTKVYVLEGYKIALNYIHGYKCAYDGTTVYIQ